MHESQSELQMKMKIEMEMEKEKMEMASICSTAKPAGHLTCNNNNKSEAKAKRNATTNFCANCDNGNEISHSEGSQREREWEAHSKKEERKCEE